MDEKKEKQDLLVIKPSCRDSEKTKRLDTVLTQALSGRNYTLVEHPEEMASHELRNRRVLFAVSLGTSGVNLEYYRMLKYIRNNPTLLDGCVGGLIMDSSGEFHTKDVSRGLVLAANMAGCAFIGRPLVEGTGELKNFSVQAKLANIDNNTAYVNSAIDLVERLLSDTERKVENPKLLVLHAGLGKDSNTLALWHMIKERLPGGIHATQENNTLGDMVCQEISLREGKIQDCRGCSYETCRFLGEQSQCFYGGIITKEVYPAILDCDGLVLLCPNYNDAIGGNMTAFVNRLTALYSVNRFYDKQLFAVIVSGYSGSDIVAQQIISGLNMNKSFYLPPRFAIMETANAPGSIYEVENIREKAAAFANAMASCFDGKR